MKFINNQFMKVENIAQLVPRYLYLKDTRLLFVHCFLLDLKTVRTSAIKDNIRHIFEIPAVLYSE